MRFLLTGATGFLGREVLVRLLARGDEVLVTTRPRDTESEADAAGRLAAMVERTEPGTPTRRLTVAHGDVTAPDLELSSAARGWLKGSGGPIHVVHGAAEVRFDLPYPRMREQNVVGTEHVLNLARELAGDGRLARMDHVSTAYVAGDRMDVALESEVDVGQTPRNDYERTKLEAEQAVQAARADGLPVTVHRPSIIVGDSRTGRASSFKVLYWPMKVYARGRFRTLFGRPGCTVDVVPVDYVADAMVHLFGCREAAGRTFHLAAGPERQATIAELVAIAEQMFQRKPVRYVDPDFYFRWLRPFVLPLLKLFRPDVAQRGGVFLPYFRSNPTFAVDQASELLLSAGISPPPVTAYFDAIIRFARDTDFGRRTLPATVNPDRPGS